MTYYWDDKAQRYRRLDGKFVNPDRMPNQSAPKVPQTGSEISHDTALLLKALASIDKKLAQQNKHHKAASSHQSDLSIGIELTIQWLLAFLLFVYPTIVRLVQDPIGTFTGTNLGTEIYSKEIQEGDTIGGFTVPVGGGYGDRAAPKDGASTNHKGVDLPTPPGVQLNMLGTGIGKVECQEQPGKAGTYATITPTGIPFTFRAMHLSQCTSGEFEPGQAFAATGNTGNSTGPHLHWEQHKDRNPVHPTAGYLLWTLKGIPPSPVVDTARSGLGSLYSRIVQQESGGDSTQINPDSGAIGLAQVMPSNVPSWTQQCLGTSLTADQFAADADAQKKTIDCKLQEFWTAAKASGESEYEQCRSVAAQWYAGDRTLKDSDAPQAGYPSIRAYTTSVCSGF
jgi:murein DD-endopeptidase MepM/ murein hydrolase activator NlpD